MFYKQQVEKEKLKVAGYSFPATFTTAHEPSFHYLQLNDFHFCIVRRHTRDSIILKKFKIKLVMQT